MSFFTKEDKIILMNCNADMGGWNLKWYSMDTDEIKSVRDRCGVTVGLEQIYWHDIEKSPGVYNWSLPDRQVKRNLDAGMRLILCTPFSVPTCLPQDWYWKSPYPCQDHLGLSFWHPEAQEYERDFLEKVIARYSGADVHVIFHEFLGGEQVMWNMPSFYDKMALADFKEKYGGEPVVGSPKDAFPLSPETREWLREKIIEHFIFMQPVFMKQHNEIWMDLQPNIAFQSEANGNFARYDIHKAYLETFPDAEQWLMMYTHWGNGPAHAENVQMFMRDFGCKVIVEANYCEGLAETAPLAIESGFQGQVVAPLHPFREHKTMEPWMYDVIKGAYDLWRNSSG
jgi:hypothetical protein